MYECDGLTAYRQLPLVVVLPETKEQLSRVLRFCNENNVKVVPRGAGTSLSGGALPLADGITIGLGKFNKIIEISEEKYCEEEVGSIRFNDCFGPHTIDIKNREMILDFYEDKFNIFAGFNRIKTRFF